MYGLPDDFDPGTFVGRRRDQVTFGENVIVLVFSDRASDGGCADTYDSPRWRTE